MSESPVRTVLESRPRDLGGVPIGRLLPAPRLRSVGPFVFLDHMGPVRFEPGRGMDVPPHPHIGLATVTYLFEGEIVHRDSTGAERAITPGAVNWMIAGRGVVHSERTSERARAEGQTVHGLQLWVAVPEANEVDEPSFAHHPVDSLPTLSIDGARVRVLIGTAFGHTSPVDAVSPTVYVDLDLPEGVLVPIPDGYEERCLYVVEGAIACGGTTYDARRLLVLEPGEPTVRAETKSRVVLLGGAKLDAPRLMDWNFVASTSERIEEAKLAWREDRFPRVPGDEDERVPYPG